MQRRLKGIIKSCLFLGIASLIWAPEISAVEISGQQGPSVPCAVLEDFGGGVQILDSTRKKIVDATRKAGVSCGGWVSVESGWAHLNHRDGHRIRLGSKTFVQFLENNPDGYFSGDPVQLYKGQLLGQAGGGSGELRVITANARMRVGHGSAILIYDVNAEETQLVQLEKTATLENRFEPTGKVTVRAGEASSLNLKQMRVTPTLARAVSVASLKPRLQDLHVRDREKSFAVRTAQERSERTFASILDPDVTGEPEKQSPHKKAHSHSRKPASQKIVLSKNYSRHSAPTKEDEEVSRHIIQRMVAGEREGEQILYPDRFAGNPQKVKIEIEDVDSKAAHARHQKDDEEKRRVLEELSRIREE